MLSRHTEATTSNPEGRGASDASVDGRKRHYRAGTTGHQGRFRQETGLLILFGDGPRDYSSLGSAPAGLRSGECRMISVELAKRLKEAGFPQRGKAYRSCRHIAWPQSLLFPR